MPRNKEADKYFHCRCRLRSLDLDRHLLRRGHYHPWAGVRARWCCCRYVFRLPTGTAQQVVRYVRRRADPIAGSIAAGFQAAMYGGFTPAGGIFATLTSRGMSGMLMPAAVIAAIVLATGVAVVVGVCGVGR